MIMAHGDEGVVYGEEAVRIASQTGARAIESHALDTLGILTAYSGDVDEGLAMLWRSHEIAREIGSVEEMGRASGNITDALIFAAGRDHEAGDLGIKAIGPVDAPSMTGVAAAIQSARHRPGQVPRRTVGRGWRKPWRRPACSRPGAQARSRSASGPPSWPSAAATSRSRRA